MAYMKYKVDKIEPSTQFLVNFIFHNYKVIQVSSQAWDCTNEESGSAGRPVLDFPDVFFYS